ncbi:MULTISPECIES: hypothetical protein [Shewanella]|uniref:Uncharacterized protein n=1 Tax=Shewanella fidelis TaxID=173509 RepID=A0AAW8NRC9_9GAMM|nr:MULTISPECIES: hypothetical protein [Shewanella]MDR8524900.1 hypothetical protein [Shewanella fidelis]MDW4810971.1 hypothetical protein [Shewanella fidelis]MDW4815250.1 hypothetical protein [Shewanella fidelis]MDW4819340.1 hypothetical protein [Shewanella fidelis]MDW4822982.1 hypothetical protein [Shewanella fidelis]
MHRFAFYQPLPALGLLHSSNAWAQQTTRDVKTQSLTSLLQPLSYPAKAHQSINFKDAFYGVEQARHIRNAANTR